jgi:hypothetical protein
VLKPTVTVHVNRGSPETLEPAVTTFETNESFDLVLQGHDTPSHVHCRLDKALDGIVTLSQSNYYVEADAQTPVPVTVAADRIDEHVGGRLEILTGYGSESVSIRLVVEPTPGRVDVDESLAEPAPRSVEPETTPLFERIETATGLAPATLGVVALGVVAVVIALGAAVSIGGTSGAIGLLLVILAVVGAIISVVR